MPTSSATAGVRRPLWGRPGGSEWRREFALLWSGTAASLLGGEIASVAMPLLALSLGGSLVFAGWLAAAGTLPQVLLHVPAGALVDRLDRRRTMLVAQAVRGTTAITTVLLLTCGLLPRSLLILTAVVNGVCVTFFSVAEVSAVPLIVPENRLAKGMSRNEARSHAAVLLGRLVGGLLFGLRRFVPLLADSVACLVSCILLRKLRVSLKARDEVAQDDRMVEGLLWLWRDRFLLRTVLVAAFTNLLFQVVILVLVARLEGRHSGPMGMGVLPAMNIGAVLAASGCGGFLGAFVAPRVLRRWFAARNGLSQAVVFCVCAWTAFLFIIAASPFPLFWFLAWGGVGFVGAHMNVILTTYTGGNTPRWLLGRVSGAQRFIVLGAVPLGTASAGHAIAITGPQMTAWSVTSAMALAALVLLVHRRLAPDRRNDPEHRPSHPELTAVQQGSPGPRPGLSPGDQEGEKPYPWGCTAGAPG